MASPLILVGGQVKTYQSFQAGSNKDIGPRLDYIELAKRLGGDISTHRLLQSVGLTWARRIESRLKLDFVQAMLAATQLSSHNLILSTSERTAIPLAMLLKAIGSSKPHIVIGHHFSSINKKRLFRIWKLHDSFAFVISVCRAQAEFVVRQFHYPAANVSFIYDKVDHQFFRPLGDNKGDYILTVGQEQRDFQCLVRAISGTGIKLVIIASSPWSDFSLEFENFESITALRNLPYRELRELYNNARLVVLPLHEVDYAAGVNTVLESMAMSKALIVSRTNGIKDYVIPHETGIFTSPENSEELRDAILDLWDDPGERQRLGENARRVVEEKMNLDIYVNRVAQIVEDVVAV
jgi:glycosyltransferase involved in cell wall biosynthesis